jgi:hypothetical protein
MIFSRVDMVVNSTPLDKIVPTLEAVVADRRQGGSSICRSADILGQRREVHVGH